MEKFKEYLKVFAYIFYPGMVLILYLAQGLEGKLGLDLIFCPTDIIVLLAILGIYMLLDAFKVFDAKVFDFMKKNDGRLKVPFLLAFLLIIAVLMGLYDDLKVYFYLNNDVSINLFIIIALGLGLAGIAFLLNKSEK